MPAAKSLTTGLRTIGSVALVIAPALPLPFEPRRACRRRSPLHWGAGYSGSHFAPGAQRPANLDTALNHRLRFGVGA